MTWKEGFMGFLANTIQEQKMRITTWKLHHEKDFKGLLKLLHYYLEKRSDRYKYLDIHGIAQENWETDWKIMNIRRDIYYIHRELEDLLPESIDPMRNILKKEKPNFPLVDELLSILSEIQEPKAVPLICKFLKNEKDPCEICDFIWYIGELGRVREVVDRDRPEGLIRYFEFDREQYHAYLDDEVREQQIKDKRKELIPIVEPYLSDDDGDVRIQAYIALKKMRPNVPNPKLIEFEKSHPHLDFEEFKKEYAPPSCFKGGKDFK